MFSVKKDIVDLFNTVQRKQEEAKALLLTNINKFGAHHPSSVSAFESLQLADSTLRAMDFVSPEWLASDEFENMSEDEAEAFIQKSITLLAAREERFENRFSHCGTDARTIMEASGVMQIKVKLSRFINSARQAHKQEVDRLF